ncbi:hypothetical protein ACOQFO_08315 [Ureibacillus sp. MALMAid1270]|uniref:hypothetical protein n=1 Tax=Ureibacillus sp. MALMAid1270 TaxID=3411629 RepID=UPI003BA7408A
MAGETQTLTLNDHEFQQLVNIQRKVKEHFENNASDAHTIEMSLAAFSSSLLGLALWKFTPYSVALSIISLLAGASSTIIDGYVQTCKNGELALLTAKNTMNNLRGVSARVTITYKKLNGWEDLYSVDKVTTHYVTLADGRIVY